MTLIEIMVVVFIIAFTIAIAIPRLSGTLGFKTKSVVRKLVAINKQLQHNARLRNKVYRLVINFGADNGRPSFYAESADKKTLVEPPDAKSKSSWDDDDKEDPFTTATEITKEPIELPTGVVFSEVEIDGYPSVKEGIAYIHFFPQGLVQKSVIHIDDGRDLKWSVIIPALAGRSFIRTEDVRLKDVE